MDNLASVKLLTDIRDDTTISTTNLSDVVASVESSMAKYGVEIVTDTVARTGKYVGIIVFSDAVIAALTPRVALTGSNSYASLPLVAGMCLPLEFTSITLTSGKIGLVVGSW